MFVTYATSCYLLLILPSATFRVKHKISTSIDADTIRWIDAEAERGRFSNRSHGFEYCARIVKDRDLN